MNKIEVSADMRNPSLEIVKLCKNAVYGSLREPDSRLNPAWGKWMFECTQGACKKDGFVERAGGLAGPGSAPYPG
ncbi:hypothetical protein [Desulfomicrobium baculatum]|uniref:hypothetical protein n=1 Tax=Desulfomicrobium baculatum TaxID=899 RepID=UPI00117D1D2A|nr:hypothetical protein [Desulfomicrobium baculatum]